MIIELTCAFDKVVVLRTVNRVPSDLYNETLGRVSLFTLFATRTHSRNFILVCRFEPLTLKLELSPKDCPRKYHLHEDFLLESLRSNLYTLYSTFVGITEAFLRSELSKVCQFILVIIVQGKFSSILAV